MQTLLGSTKQTAAHSLRPYQDAVVDAVMAALDGGVTRIYYVLPTGTGKTLTFTQLIRQMISPGRPAVVIAHREELLSQARDSVLRADPGLRVGIERAGCVAPRNCDVIVASVQTVGRKGASRLSWIGNGAGAACIICDEAHHACADGYARAFNLLTARHPHTPLIGCTATPSRHDELALHGTKGAPFEQCVYNYSIRDAIDDGWLCQIRGHRVATGIDLSNIKTVAGDYAVNALADAVNVDARTEKAVEHWREIAGDRQTIVFCVNVKHAEDACRAWQNIGCSAAVVTGAMESDIRRRMIADYKSGRIQVIVNCEVLTEGFDAPETSCIVMLRPTKSWGLYAQCVGRGTRLKHGEFGDCIVLDVVDNTITHKLDTAPESTKAKSKKTVGEASVSSLLGLPSGIDLEGHTVTEAANLKTELEGRAEIMERYRPQTFSDLETMLHSVDMFAGITANESRQHSAYQWVQTKSSDGGDDWLLSAGSGQWAKLRAGDTGRWWKCIRIDNGAEEPALTTGPVGTDNLAEAMQSVERECELLFGGIHTARIDARWRSDRPSDKQKALLVRRGISSALVDAMSKGEASAMITKLLGR